jgi:hypothetical protein
MNKIAGPRVCFYFIFLSFLFTFLTSLHIFLFTLHISHTSSLTPPITHTSHHSHLPSLTPPITHTSHHSPPITHTSHHSHLPSLTLPNHYSLTPPPPHLQLRSLADLTAVEVAEGITQLQMEAASHVPLTEFMHKRFMKAETSPMIKRVVNLSNQITKMVKYEILRISEMSSRVLMIEHLLHVAKILKEMNNYEGLCGVGWEMMGGGVMACGVGRKFLLLVSDFSFFFFFFFFFGKN